MIIIFSENEEAHLIILAFVILRFTSHRHSRLDCHLSAPDYFLSLSLLNLSGKNGSTYDTSTS